MLWGWALSCIQAVVPCAFPRLQFHSDPIFLWDTGIQIMGKMTGTQQQRRSPSLPLSLFVTHQFSGRTNFLLHKIHAVAALGWTVLFVLCCEYKLFGSILSYSDVRSSCSSAHSPIHCLPLLKKEVLPEEMNCIPKSWVCTLLCSNNADPDPGAHGKCLVLGEVYLTAVCWTVNPLG